VRACKMQASSPVIYISCQFLAEELSRNPAPVPRPYQGRIGDCWLLAAMCGLHAFFPGLLLSMVVLGKKEAIIHFPRRAITVNYVLPFQAAPCSGLVGAFVHLGVQLCVPADLYWALLEKAMCVHLLLEGDPNLGARRQARRLRGNLGSGPHYSDIDGGTIYEALAALSPTFVKHPVRILGFNKEAFKKLRREGPCMCCASSGSRALTIGRVTPVAQTSSYNYRTQRRSSWASLSAPAAPLAREEASQQRRVGLKHVSSTILGAQLRNVLEIIGDRLHLALEDREGRGRLLLRGVRVRVSIIIWEGHRLPAAPLPIRSYQRHPGGVPPLVIRMLRLRRVYACIVVFCRAEQALLARIERELEARPGLEGGRMWSAFVLEVASYVESLRSSSPGPGHKDPVHRAQAPFVVIPQGERGGLVLRGGVLLETSSGQCEELQDDAALEQRPGAAAVAAKDRHQESAR
jgi:hypothetical protein